MANRSAVAVTDPEEIADRWNYPSLTPGAKRLILGLNSARLYGLPRAAIRYNDGALPTYPADPALQSGGQMDTILRGVVYPEPGYCESHAAGPFRQGEAVARRHRCRAQRTRFGWMRTRV